MIKIQENASMAVDLDIISMVKIAKYVLKTAQDVQIVASVPYVKRDIMEPIACLHVLGDAKMNCVIKIQDTVKKVAVRGFIMIIIALNVSSHVQTVLDHIIVPSVRRAFGEWSVRIIARGIVTDAIFKDNA